MFAVSAAATAGIANLAGLVAQVVRGIRLVPDDELAVWPPLRPVPGLVVVRVQKPDVLAADDVRGGDIVLA
jgi:hypothetical protein